MKLTRQMILALSSTMLCGMAAKSGPPDKSKSKTKDEPEKDKVEDEEKDKSTDTALTTEVNFEEDAGDGTSDFGADDLAIPRLAILQALSPAVQKKKDTYIEGAEAGEVMDTVSQDIFSGDAGFDFIFCTYRKTHIEWVLREKGGGFVADLGESAECLAGCTKDEKGRYINAAGNQVVATAEYFGFKVDAETGSTRPYVISMTGAQIKHSRKLNTMMNTYRVKRASGQGEFNPAMFYRAYHLTTQVEEKNGNSWFGWNIVPSVEVPKLPDGINVYNQAKAFRQSVIEGTIKAAKASSDEVAHEADSSPM